MQSNWAMLKTVDLSNLINWSVRYLLDNTFSYNKNYKLVSIGDFLTRNDNLISVQDEVDYQRVTVKINNNGVYLRDIEKGKYIGTKKQYEVNSGQFIMSKIDARNGAFGIIPDELNGAIVTNDFPTFIVNENEINIQFLVLITTTKKFINFAQSCSSGTTNRQRIDIDLFLNVKIPLPSLNEQNRIVKNYNDKLAQAKQQKAKAKQIEKDIENYLFDTLGIRKLENEENQKGLQFTNFKNLDRWDVLAKNLKIINGLSTSKFELKNLGNAFKFPFRSWKKNEHKENVFNYIELGGIDPNFGIKITKLIELEKAPSRATQQVETNDLIIGTTRPYLKRFAIIEENFSKYICSSGFCIIEADQNYDLNFLKEFLMSFYGIEQLKNRMSGGTYPAITNDELKEVKIPFPPPLIQKEIGNYIRNLKEQIKDLQNQAKQNRESAIKEFEQEIFN